MITQMAKVYSSASHVLVLAAELLSIKLPSTPDEALFRIFFSRWNTRLWGMQEAALAGDLVFQFSDKAVRYNALTNAMKIARADITDHSRFIVEQATMALNDVVKLRSRSTASELLSDHFWSELQNRSTSRPLDVAISGSILLDSDVSRVLKAPDDEKMKTFWSCQKRVPASVLWVDGPRLKEDGLRWATSNLLDPEAASSILLTSPAAEPTDDRLLFDGVEAILMENFALPKHDRHLFRFALPGTPQKYVLMKTPGPTDTWTEPKELWDGRWTLPLRQLPSRQAVAEPATLTIPVRAIGNEECAQDIATPIYARAILRRSDYCGWRGFCSRDGSY